MPFDHIDGLTVSKEHVAIMLMRGAFGFHVGIAFNPAKKDLHILHLRSHKQLAVDEVRPQNAQCWIGAIVDIPGSVAKQFVPFLRAVAKRLPSIPYGINLLTGVGSFDALGHYKPPRGSDGLTCATFVTEIFAAAGLPLIRLDTWESDLDNIRWGEDVCAFLQSQSVDEEHVAAVRKNISGLRVRPEEVAASAGKSIRDRPVAHRDVKAEIPAVVHAFNLHCPQGCAIELPALTVADKPLGSSIQIK